MESFTTYAILGAFLLLSTAPAAAQTVANETSPQPNIYDVYDVCDAYFDFLNKVENDSVSDCDVVSRFLIENRHEKNPYYVLSHYEKELAAETPFEILLSGFGAFFLGEEELSFWLFDDAGKVAVSGYTSIDDPKRGQVYDRLIDRTKMEVLAWQLKKGSTLFEEYPGHNASSISPPYVVIERNPGSAVLACLIRSDNQRVELDVVIRSPFLSSCIDGFNENSE